MVVAVSLQVMMSSSSSLLQRKLIVLLLLVLVMNIITIEVPIIHFAESLALLPTQSNTNTNTDTNTNQQQPTLLETSSSSSRREVLSNLFSTGSFLATVTTVTAATVLLEPDVAEAAIDVSTLRSQQQFKSAVLSTTSTLPLNSAAGSSPIGNTDIFLGGTYVDDDDKSNNKKYYISLSGLGFAGYRLITVKGGSNLDDFVELPGMIFTCPVGGPTADGSGGQRQCITIDLSSIGGIKDAQGYWDDDNNGIRFVLENNIWSKKQ